MGSEVDTLLVLRRRELEQTEGGLAEAQRERGRRQRSHLLAQEKLQAAEAAVQKRVQQERQHQREAFRGGQWVDERAYQARLLGRRDETRVRVAATAEALSVAEAAVEAARQALLEARRQVQVLEKHAERVAAEGRLQDQRRAEKEQDDLANARHGRET